MISEQTLMKYQKDNSYQRETMAAISLGLCLCLCAIKLLLGRKESPSSGVSVLGSWQGSSTGSLKLGAGALS